MSKTASRALGEKTGKRQEGAPDRSVGGTHTSERILGAAVDLFSRQGFHGTSVKEITVACGITPGAMYNHFPSKESVLYELISRAADEGDELLDAALSRAKPDPASQLRALVYETALYHCRHRAMGMVLMFEYHNLPEPERGRIIKRRHQERERFERILKDGVDQGVFVLPAVSERADNKNGRHTLKMVATAVANVAIRATEIFGPRPAWSDEQVASFHADLALEMVGVHQPTPRKRKP